MAIVAGVGTAVGRRPLMGNAPRARVLERAMAIGVRIALRRGITLSDTTEVRRYLLAAQVLARAALGETVNPIILAAAVALYGTDVRRIRRALVLWNRRRIDA